VIQIFGTRKCAGTRRAERFFRERGVPIQLIDLSLKGPSPGELRSIAQAVGGVFKLFDRDGKRARDRGLHRALLGDPDIERELQRDPLLLRTPIVRHGKDATVSVDTPRARNIEDTWNIWAKK
jgi:arsenate reductase-like glutaredoxin family protein